MVSLVNAPIVALNAQFLSAPPYEVLAGCTDGAPLCVVNARRPAGVVAFVSPTLVRATVYHSILLLTHDVRRLAWAGRAQFPVNPTGR
jgi:hypothetical protein